MLNGEDVTANTFKIQQYGVLAAIFDIDNGIRNVQTEAVKVVKHNGNIIIMGLQPETDYQIYDVLGKMLYTGMTDANGSAEISLSTGHHLIIIKQNDTVIKIRC